MDTNNFTPILTCTLKIPTNSYFKSSYGNNNYLQIINSILVEFRNGILCSIKEEKSLSSDNN